MQLPRAPLLRHPDRYRRTTPRYRPHMSRYYRFSMGDLGRLRPCDPPDRFRYRRTGSIRCMSSADDTMTVLVYSDDPNTRAQIRMAIGRRPAADLPRVAYVECATGPAVFAHL